MVSRPFLAAFVLLALAACAGDTSDDGTTDQSSVSDTTTDGADTTTTDGTDTTTDGTDTTTDGTDTTTDGTDTTTDGTDTTDGIDTTTDGAETTGEDTGGETTTGDDTTGGDTGTAEPKPDLVIASASEPPMLTIQDIFTGGAQWTASASGDAVLVATDAQVLQIEELGAEPLPVTDAPVGPAYGSVALHSGEQTITLLLGADAVWVLNDEALVVSPMSTQFTGGVPSGAVAAPSPSGGQDLWFSGPDGLHLLRDGLLFQITLGETPTDNALLAWGPEWDGQPALWVASGSALTAVVETPDGILAWPVHTELAVEAMSASADGRLFVAADNDLHVLELDGEWRWVRIVDQAVRDIWAMPDGNLWVKTADALWLNSGKQWWPVLDTPPHGLSMDDQGRLLGLTAEGVARVVLGDVPEPEPLTATWTDEIQPLADERCLLCHSMAGYASTKLFTAEQWEERIADILFVVKEGSMPLGYDPLGAKSVAIIEAWLEGGFQP